MASSTDRQTLLALLGVDRDAPWEEVRRAFRAAVRENHPDLHDSDPEAEQRVKALTAAWELVNTPSKWSRYVGRPMVPAGTVIPTFGRLHIRRQRRGGTGLRQWRIELDGEVVATIENGGTSQFEAQPGRHSMRVFYDNYSSLPLEVELRAGVELMLGCRQQPKALLSLYAPKRSLLLELLDSRRFT